MTIYGLDTLAAARYSKRAAKWALPAAGLFFRTFGGSRRTIRRLAERCSHLRVQGIWHDDHRFGRRDLRVAIKRAKVVHRISTEYPDCAFYFSPFCEHRLSKRKAERFLNKIQEAVPDLTLVNTPDPRGAFVDGFINEVHHSLEREKPEGEYIFSFDGMDALTADVQAFKEKYHDAKLFFLWTPRFNLKESLYDSTPRPDRKAKPRKREFEAMRSLIC